MHSAFLRPAVLLLLCLSLPLAAEAAPPRGKQPPPKDEFGLLIEPWVGGTYGSMSGDTTRSVAAAESLTLLGYSLGGQAGAVYRNWFLAVRGNYLGASNSQLPGSVKDIAIGAVIGGTLGSFPMRFWAGANFVDNFDNGAGRILKSDSYIVGAGYFLNNMISVNAEYHSRSFGRVTVNGTSLQPTYTDFTITLSRPFTIGIPTLPELAHESMNAGPPQGGSEPGWRY